jgi:DNA-binding NarL/FixJ family response regulator
LSENDFQNKVRTAVIADDHAVVRNGIREVLARIANLRIVAECRNGLEAIAAVKKHSPDLLVLDAAMPLARGVEVFADVRRWSPETRVALFTGFTSVGMLADWLSAGVDGLFLKSGPMEELQAGLVILLEGGNYVSRDVADMLENVALHDMTGREREVLALIASGHANTSIAERLHISPKTVEKHRASLMAKLGVHSVAELMVYALREGLLEDKKQL